MIDTVTAEETAGEAGEPGEPSPKWTFVRAADGRVGGVCQSLSVATGVDLSLVRLAMIGAALWGPGLLAYVALVVAVPRAAAPDDPRVRPAPEDTARWMRIALAVAGITGLLSVIGGIGWSDWPVGSFYRDGGGIGLTLVALAVAVIVVRRNRRDGEPVPARAETAPETAHETAPQMAPQRAAPMATAERATVVSPALPLLDDRPETDADANRVALLVARITGWLFVLGALTVAAALAAAVVIGILEVRLPALVWTAGAAVLIGAGVALAVTRSIGVIAAALGAVALVWSLGALATSWTAPTGTRTVIVADAAQLASRYEHAAGRLTLDLSGLALDAPAAVAVDNRAGVVDVVVPDDLAVEVHSDVAVGESLVLGQQSDGWNLSERVRAVPAGATAVLTIDLDVGVGSGRVCRLSDADADHHCPR